VSLFNLFGYVRKGVFFVTFSPLG